MVNKNLTSLFILDEAIASTSLEDRISVPSSRTLTDAGQMLVPCKFARTGSQKYLASQVFTSKTLLDQEELSADDIIELHRDEATVFEEKSIETFRSAPVTIGHPKDKDGKPIPVTSENSKELQVGVLEGMPTRDGDTLGGTLVLTAQEAIDALEGGTQELSAGYTCDIVKVDGKYCQRNVRANHIAIVPKGRAGASCRISDEALVVQDDHPEPMREDFKDSDSYDNAMAIWKENEAAEPKEVSNTAMVDEALLTDAQAQIITLTDQLIIQKDLVALLQDSSDKAELAVEAMKVELSDAKVAATQGVVERCEVIENARLIADMRDLGDKSLEQIKLLVVEDQYPEKDFSEKSPAFVDAMFEMLVDSSKGETPMSKLMKHQHSHVIADAKTVNPVEEARKKMIARQKKQS